MAKVPEYHTNTDPADPVYHVYDDCPAGKRVFADGSNVEGTGGFVLCGALQDQTHHRALLDLQLPSEGHVPLRSGQTTVRH